VADVYNLIRGTNPQPGAWTTLAGKTLQIFDSEKVEASGRPGEIVSISDEGFTVVAGNGGILVMRVRLDGAAKVAATEFVAATGIKAGTQLGE
jgi:methionyl-tRNA formyltransferase